MASFFISNIVFFAKPARLLSDKTKRTRGGSMFKMSLLHMIKGVISLLIIFVFSAQAKQAYVPGEVIVKLKAKNSKDGGHNSFLSKAYSQKGLSLKNSWGKMDMYHFSAKAGQNVHQLIDQLNQDPEVEYAELNYLITKASINDQMQSFSAKEIEEMAAEEDFLATSADIQAKSVWGSLSVPSTKPIVAVIDTGVDITHNVFVQTNAIWTNSDEIAGNGIDDDNNGYVDDVNGWNYVSNSGAMIDDDGHGTHVSGIILGVGQSIFAGPFEDAKIQIMPLKFLDSNGIGKTSDAIKAIYYAVDNGAKVLNNSWGGPSYSAALHEAVAYSYERKTIFVAAAGNNGDDNDSSPMYPSSYLVPHVISVAATSSSDFLTYFSNYGFDSVHIGSPGQYILSTWPGGGYTSLSGTSMAAPFVSGVAALMAIESPGMNGYQMKNIIFNQADPISQLNAKVHTESRVNVSNTVNAAKTTTVDSYMPSYQFTNGDRELASALVNAGGCGTVGKMYADYHKNQRGPKGPASGLGFWQAFLLVVILFAPAISARIAHHRSERKIKQRRRHERFEINTGVKVKVGDRVLTANVSSISMGGVQIDTHELLEKGGILNMTIQSPDGLDQVQVQGKVVWSADKKSYGVQFSETKENALSRISMWTKGLKTT